MRNRVKARPYRTVETQLERFFPHRTRKAAAIASLVSLALSGCGGLIGRGGPGVGREEPLSAVAPVELADQVAARAGEACGAELREQLLEGLAAPGDCDASASKAARATIVHNGVHFGVVSHRDVELDAVRLRLSEARLCAGWPLPLEQGAGVVLDERDAVRAGCMIRPYRGKLTLTAIDAEGKRHHAFMVDVDRDGVARFEFGEVEASLRRTMGQGLDAYLWLELGETAWAGTINLERLREFTADWHFVWVAKGRGSAALFAERHAEHRHGADAQAMALESRLDRQRQDFDAVAEGTMSATAFLDRHVWSPFRQAVEDLRVTAQ